MQRRDQPRGLREPAELVRDRSDDRPLQAGGTARVLALQRSAGNHSVSARLARDPDTAKQEPEPGATSLAMVPEVGTIPLLSMSFGARSPTGAGSSGGASNERSSIREIMLTSKVGEHSPKLMQALAAGKAGTVEIVTPSRTLTLKGAIVSSYSTGSASGNPTEAWSLNFESFEQK
jgi:hypothetical protein